MVRLGVINLSSATAVCRQHVDTNHWRFQFLSASTCSVNQCAGTLFLWFDPQRIHVCWSWDWTLSSSSTDLLVSWELLRAPGAILKALNDAVMEVQRAAGSLPYSNLQWHQGTANAQNQAVLCNILFVSLILPLFPYPSNTWTSCVSLLKSRPKGRESVQWDRCWFLFSLCNQKQRGILIPWQSKTHIDLRSAEVWDIFFCACNSAPECTLWPFIYMWQYMHSRTKK